MPSTQPSSRLAARLGQLPHGVLANLAARLSSDSPALQAAAEECMAAHTPLPHEMVERVLLSPDLVPHILGPLVAEDGAAAAVCSQWLDGWKATNEPRRRLKQVPLDLPEELVTGNSLDMAGTPGGRLVVRTRTEVHILDRTMRVLQTMPGDLRRYNNDPLSQTDMYGLIAANDDSMFSCCVATGGVEVLCRFTHDGTASAKFQPGGQHFYSPVLAPGGLLFCVVQGEQDEIVALDTQTLELRYRFGLGLLNDANQLAVVGDELYACDTGNHRLQVFSLTGEHRRSIVGEWQSPEQLCCVADRLYLVERERELDDYGDGDGDGGGTNAVRGQRILVLSLQGDILQVVTHPTEPTARFRWIYCVGRKLLARYLYIGSTGTSPVAAYGVLALQGL